MPASSIDGAREEGFHYKQHKHALGGGGRRRLSRANVPGYRQYLRN